MMKASCPIKIHEHQAKKVLSDFGIMVPPGGVASTPIQARDVAQAIDSSTWVVKAQTHIKGPEPQHASSLDEVAHCTQAILEAPLGTSNQTVRHVYVEKAYRAEAKFSISLGIDTQTASVFITADTKKGENTTVTVDPSSGFQPFHGRKLAFALGLINPFQITNLTSCLKNLYRAFWALDTQYIKIDSLGLLENHTFVALDVDLTFDPYALYRHKAIESLRDWALYDPLEHEAMALGFYYKKLDGTVGCMVNGTGLALATIDMLHLKGVAPSNILNIASSVSPEKVVAAFQFLVQEEQSQAFLVNIFGDTVHCDLIAQGIVKATQEAILNVPLIVRLEGANMTIGQKTLQKAKVPIIIAKDLQDATQHVFEIARQRKGV